MWTHVDKTTTFLGLHHQIISYDVAKTTIIKAKWTTIWALEMEMEDKLPFPKPKFKHFKPISKTTFWRICKRFTLRPTKKTFFWRSVTSQTIEISLQSVKKTVFSPRLGLGIGIEIESKLSIPIPSLLEKTTNTTTHQ